MPVTYDDWTPIAGNAQPLGEGRARTWYRTPNFRSLAKGGGLPINPYSDQNLRVRQDSYEARIVSGSGSTAIYQHLVYDRLNDIMNAMHDRTVNHTSWMSDSSGIINRTKIKALNKCADAKVNLAVAFAEATKTSNLILDTARRIDRAYRAFRRGNLGEVARQLNITPKRLHKSWLEYKYGWLPLLMDVKGSAEFLAQKALSRKPWFKVIAREKLVKSYSYAVNVTPFGGAPQIPITWNLFPEYEVEVGIECEIDYLHLAEMQQLGLTNPALVAWELVPYSFVLDWFVSVGDYLTALTALQGLVVKRAFIASSEQRAGTLNIPGTVRVQGTDTYYSDTHNAECSHRGYVRSNWIPDTLEMLELYPPRNSGLDFKKLVTSLALIRSAHRGPGESIGNTRL